MVHFEADDKFLKSIRVFAEDHFFKLGADGVQIRGGERAESARSKGKKKASPGKSNTNIKQNTISKILDSASAEVLENEERREREEFQHTSKPGKGKAAEAKKKL